MMPIYPTLEAKVQVKEWFLSNLVHNKDNITMMPIYLTQES